MSGSQVWYAVVNPDGSLFSIGTTVASPDALLPGLVVRTVTADPTGLLWDAPSQSFVAPPAAPVVLDRIAFMLLFTSAERIALRTSSDPAVQDFLWLVDNAATIALADPHVAQGLAYCASINVLTAARVSAIGAGQPPS